jgi:Putative DNA-binding domain
MSSQAFELFKRLEASPIDEINRMLKEQERETEYLEFKGGSRLNPKEIKRYWSQALSGFANTEGGVLVWGVDARKTPSADHPEVEIEAACGLDYVAKPFELADTLDRKRLDATADPVGGVQIRAIDAAAGQGFVICYIPEGKHKPYRASLDETQNYFHRVRDSFVVISHSFLRSLFFPQTGPSLNIEATITSGTDDATTIRDSIGRECPTAFVRGHLMLQNSGTGSARNIFSRLITAKGLPGARGWRLCSQDVAKG